MGSTNKKHDNFSPDLEQCHNTKTCLISYKFIHDNFSSFKELPNTSYAINTTEKTSWTF